MTITEIDVLEFMLPDQVWSFGNHMYYNGDADGKGAHPILTTVVGNQIWYMKGKQGWPWDMNTFDDQYVYQSITEVSWTDPKQYKIFDSKTWPGGQGGIVWSPRIVGIADGLTHGVQTADSSYKLYSDCTHFVRQDLGGPTFGCCHGISVEDLGGDLGEQEVLVTSYQWGKNYVNMEINKYARKYGWVQWELWEMENGLYVQKKKSAFNRFAEGGAPTPVFPCYDVQSRATA